MLISSFVSYVNISTCLLVFYDNEGVLVVGVTRLMWASL